MIEFSVRMENEIYNQIIERTVRNDASVSNLETQPLKELDSQVINFHSARLELLALEKQLGEILFDVFEHPSDLVLKEFVRITYRFRELMIEERAMLDERIDTWQRFRAILETEYRVKIELDFDWTHLAAGAFVDLMKYALKKDPIPEGLMTAVSADIMKEVVQAKGSETFLNLIVHYGGIGALKRHMSENEEIMNALDRYAGIWEKQIAEEMLRFPSPI